MTKKILIGTILAVIIVLASFSSVVSAQSTKPNAFFQQIKDRIENKLWQPGWIIGHILGFIWELIATFFPFIFGP